VSQTTHIVSPNTSVMPTTASVNDAGHLVIGGCDTVKLAEEFGTPLYLVDEASVVASIAACSAGLSSYKKARILYAGKAFLCTAMCRLIAKHGVGLDVVSEGELYTAIQAEFPANSIFLHGNNKSAREIEMALSYGTVRIVVDNSSELELIATTAKRLGKTASIMLRLIPGIAPDTHQHTQTGQSDSKFGIPLDEVNSMIEQALKHKEVLKLLGLHAHIGSYILDLEPFVQSVNVLADTYASVKKAFGLELPDLDVGGGLGIAYTEDSKPISLFDWAQAMAMHTASAFGQRNLKLPNLFVEPGRSIIGTAGVTIYRVGHCKQVSGSRYIAVDGGMSDNPRPITYQARYTASVANRMHAPLSKEPVTMVGRFCESGDIIVKDANLSADTGDLIAVFATGAYHYSQASNYNRTGRPACLLVNDGVAEVIIERESNSDLVRLDRIPDRLK
jgi:diaminopimelate decarboxylase